MADIDHEKGWQTLNQKSIGIEIESPGFIDPLNGADTPGQYTPRQLNAAKWLVGHLRKRFHIPAHNVLAHSDISPYRVSADGKVTLGKNDPSESFPWNEPLKLCDLSREECQAKEHFLETSLVTIGYDLNRDNKVSPKEKHRVIKYCLLAFCRHWAPQYVAWCQTWGGLDHNNIPNKLLANIKYCANNAIINKDVINL